MNFISCLHTTKIKVCSATKNYYYEIMTHYHKYIHVDLSQDPFCITNIFCWIRKYWTNSTKKSKFHYANFSLTKVAWILTGTGAVPWQWGCWSWLPGPRPGRWWRVLFRMAVPQQSLLGPGHLRWRECSTSRLPQEWKGWIRRLQLGEREADLKGRTFKKLFLFCGILE